jgi:threonine synthase
MFYVSTRGHPERIGFREATLRGLAPDFGLYVPVRWPELSQGQIDDLAGLSYPMLAARILSEFVGEELSSPELQAICTEAFSCFDHPDVAPLRQLGDGELHLLELFHGPTLAFKDYALQVLGRLLERFSEGEAPLMIIGATSGDTGSAAIHALAGRRNVRLFMLHPKDRISEVQRRQMTTVDVPNIYNIAIEGTFDNAQAIVKQLFGHRALRGLRLGAVNSINWARIAAQSVYYFFAALKLGGPQRPVAFSDPTGNFGNVYSGYAARRMGLPIERLIVATNANDICHRAISRGDYSVREVVSTQAPAMDIQVSSNFERLLSELLDRNHAGLGRAMTEFAASGRLDVSAATGSARPWLSSFAVAEAEASQLIGEMHGSQGVLLDPHSAIGLVAAKRAAGLGGVPIISLATAHSAKFPEAVMAATGLEPPVPPQIAGLQNQSEHFLTVPACADAVARLIVDATRDLVE